MALLFSEVTAYDYVQAAGREAQRAADSILADELAKNTDDQLAENILKRLGIQPLRFAKDKVRSVVSESEVTRGGLQVTFHVPVEGDMELFSVRPGTYTNRVPQADVRIREHELVISCETTSETPEQVRQWFDATLQHIQSWADNVNKDVTSSTEGLRRDILRRLSDRRTYLDKAEQMRKGLGAQ